MLTDNKLTALLIGSIFLSSEFMITKSKAEQLQASCKESLSKNARVIHDRVIGKQSDNSDLKELWKEVTRELITENIFGREDATNPAHEAYNCLENKGR